MPNPCDFVEEAAVLDDAVALNVSSPATDDGAAVLDDATAHAVSSNITEAAALDDGVEERASALFVETAVLNDEATTGGTFITLIAESAVLSDGDSVKLEQEIAETAVLDDALQLLVQSVISEAAVLNDEAVTGGTLATLISESAVLDDAVIGMASTAIVETATLDDAVLFSSRVVSLITEAAVLNDAMSESMTGASLIAETAVLNDATEDYLVGNSLIEEAAYLDDAIVGGGNAAWRAHVQPWAMSRYTNFSWNSMAVIDGVLFGAGPQGIYQLSGATDAGSDIDAEITHDWLNGAPNFRGEMVPDKSLKRPRHLYLEGVKADGQVEIALGYVTTEGAKDVAEYPLPDLSATGFINTRVALGRGIRSQHLQPTIRNVAGADFEYDSGRIVVDSLARNL